MRSKAIGVVAVEALHPVPPRVLHELLGEALHGAEEPARLDGEVALQLEDARAHLALEVPVEPPVVEPPVRVVPVVEPALHLLEPAVEPVAVERVLEVELEPRLGEEREELALEVPEVQRDVPDLLVALPPLGVAGDEPGQDREIRRARRPRRAARRACPGR